MKLKNYCRIVNIYVLKYNFTRSYTLIIDQIISNTVQKGNFVSEILRVEVYSVLFTTTNIEIKLLESDLFRTLSEYLYANYVKTYV